MHPYRRLLKGLLLIVLLVGAGWLLQSGAWGLLPDRDWIDIEVRHQGATGGLLYIGIAALFASVGLPRQVVAFLGGYAFGFVNGTLLAMLAVLLACVMSFSYGRIARRFLGVSGVPERFQRIASFVYEHTFTTTLVIRLLPAGSNLLLNLAAGLGGVRKLPFFAGSAVGYVPQMLIFALLGSGISVDPGLRIGLGVMLFFLSAILGMQLYRRYRGSLPRESA
ncbi:membrane protein, putative [hydrothermal vent metagenome]|uniref:Membrane protein, putative n=1 Tax=hydrothermal vent metagenome TaxID=652676 RepID=A0A3B0YBH3_9ZZZZ